MNDVVKVVVYLRDAGRFREMDAAYAKYFKSGEEPARVTIQAPSPMEGIDVEIEVTAVMPNNQERLTQVPNRPLELPS
jgi:enamine deaminase RidA (YjgF/YER057c/UK114 family)